MGYLLSECNPGELLKDTDFPDANGDWTVGADWDIPGNGFAYFDGPSIVSSGISQNINIIENHVLEIHLSVVGAFFSLAGKGLHVKIGGATSPLIIAEGSYVFYLLPTAYGTQLFEIASDTPNYGPADFAIMSHVSCQDTICNISKDDIRLPQPVVWYNYWEIGDNRIMLNYASRFDKTNIGIIHDPEFP